MSTYVFIKAHSGKSREKQQPYTCVSLAYINEQGEVRTCDLFTQNGVSLPNQSTLRFGDIVQPTYKESEFPGGRPSLAGLTVVRSSPYFA